MKVHILDDFVDVPNEERNLLEGLLEKLKNFGKSLTKEDSYLIRDAYVRNIIGFDDPEQLLDMKNDRQNYYKELNEVLPIKLSEEEINYLLSEKADKLFQYPAQFKVSNKKLKTRKNNMLDVWDSSHPGAKNTALDKEILRIITSENVDSIYKEGMSEKFKNLDKTIDELFEDSFEKNMFGQTNSEKIKWKIHNILLENNNEYSRLKPIRVILRAFAELEMNSNHIHFAEECRTDETEDEATAVKQILIHTDKIKGYLNLETYENIGKACIKHILGEKDSKEFKSDKESFYKELNSLLPKPYTQEQVNYLLTHDKETVENELLIVCKFLFSGGEKFERLFGLEAEISSIIIQKDMKITYKFD
jgi:hypothetical protein